jgi:prepilin-type N-terminal cleavage/methylation domain-containing protein
MRKQQSGFTLIEIAIVLVIIGLLLGGVLKGQELITAARVRNLISTQDGTKAAYFGFLDRYRALPGDYNAAIANIPGCATCTNGNQNGQIRFIAAGDAIDEPNNVWEHLSKAGFITGSYVYGAGASGAAPAGSTPANPYGTNMQLVFDAVYQGAAVTDLRHNLKTGNSIPSDILAEMDRKIDDGRGDTGQLRFSTFGGASNAGAICFSTTAGATMGQWQSATPQANCGAALLF